MKGASVALTLTENYDVILFRMRRRAFFLGSSGKRRHFHHNNLVAPKTGLWDIQT